MRECLAREVHYRTSRSSGPGGQHVNKTESRVELIWNLEDSSCLGPGQKEILRGKLAYRINARGELVLASSRHRSQQRNREEAEKRFFLLVETSLVPARKRRATKATRASKEKRLRSKKLRGEVKRSRNKPSREE